MKDTRHVTREAEKRALIRALREAPTPELRLALQARCGKLARTR